MFDDYRDLSIRFCTENVNLLRNTVMFIAALVPDHLLFQRWLSYRVPLQGEWEQQKDNACIAAQTPNKLRFGHCRKVFI
jgi:hypothetical protein